MTKIALVSLQAHLYAGRRLKPGDEFEARGQSDARLLIALKRADFAPAQQAEPVDQPAAEPERSEQPAVAAPAPQPSAEAPAQEPEQAAEQPAETPAPDAPAPTPTADADTAETPKPRRQYRRRDMQAEGSAD